MSDWPYSTEQWQRLRRNGPMSDPSYLVQTVIDLGRNGMTMDVKETLDFQNAIKPWIRRAVAHIKTDPNLEALVRKCLNETGDVRIVHYVRGECITVEACDYQKGEISEIFRQYLAPSMPSDAGGFMVPDDAKVQ